MLNDHAKDLINRAIDDELSDSEQAEWRALLDESGEARDFRQDLTELNDLLGGLPAVEPPEVLQRRILTQIQLPRPRAWFTRTAGWMQGRPVSYGVAAATGLLVAVAFYELTQAPGTPYDLSELVGTLSRGNGEAGMSQLGLLEIEVPAVRGKIVLRGDKDINLLRFELDSESPVEVRVDLAASGLEFGGFAQEARDGTDNFSYSDGSFSVMNFGEQRFTVVLRQAAGKDEARGEISVTVGREGEDLFEGVLKP